MKIDAEPIIELLQDMGINDWWNVSRTVITPPGVVRVERYLVNERGQKIAKDIVCADVEWPKR